MSRCRRIPFQRCWPPRAAGISAWSDSAGQVSGPRSHGATSKRRKPRSTYLQRALRGDKGEGLVSAWEGARSLECAYHTEGTLQSSGRSKS
eukprot:7754980-Pyramimonas_sp.AAC.1